MAFLHDLFRQKQGGAGGGDFSGVEKGGSELLPVTPPAISFPQSAVPEEPEPPLKLVLSLDDVLSRVPTRALKPGLHDPAQKLEFEMDDLLEGISRGRASIPLSHLAARYPETFQSPEAGEDLPISLPLQRLIQQIGRGSRRPKSPPADAALPPPPDSSTEAQTLSSPAEVPTASAEPVAEEPERTNPPLKLEVLPHRTTQAAPAERPSIPSLLTRPSELKEEEKRASNISFSLPPPNAADAIPTPPKINFLVSALAAQRPRPEPTPPKEEQASSAQPPAAEEGNAANGQGAEGEENLAAEEIPPSGDLTPEVEPAKSETANEPPSADSISATVQEFRPHEEPEDGLSPAGAALESLMAEPTPEVDVERTSDTKHGSEETPVSRAEGTSVEVAEPLAPDKELAAEEGKELPGLSSRNPSEEKEDKRETSNLEKPTDGDVSQTMQETGTQEETATPEVKTEASPALLGAIAEPALPVPSETSFRPFGGRPFIRPPSLHGPAGAVAPLEVQPATASAGVVFAPRPSASSTDLQPPPLPPVASAPPIATSSPDKKQLSAADLSVSPADGSSLPTTPPGEVKASSPPGSTASEEVPPAPTAEGAVTKPIAEVDSSVEADRGEEIVASPALAESENPQTSPSPLSPPPLPSLAASPLASTGKSEERQIARAGSRLPAPVDWASAGVRFHLAKVDQEPLQSIFMTEEFLDLPRVSQLSCAFPGVTGCMVIAGDTRAQGGESPGIDAAKICQLARQLVQTAELFPEELPSVQSYTIHTGNRALSIFARQHICMCVVHTHRGFLPGVRERLAAVADTLSRSLVEDEPARS